MLLDRSHVERWARRQALQIEVVHSLPKSVQRDFIKALVEAYAAGFDRAVSEMAPQDTSPEGE